MAFEGGYAVMEALLREEVRFDKQAVWLRRRGEGTMRCMVLINHFSAWLVALRGGLAWASCSGLGGTPAEEVQVWDFRLVHTFRDS